jgi:hypothetical protein
LPVLDLEGYSEAGEERPLRAYALLAIVYNAFFGGFLLLARRRGKLDDLAQQATPGNLLLYGVATHKLSRLIAKDWVTSPVRAPFATYEGPASGPEVNERPRGHGMRLALGELVT